METDKSDLVKDLETSVNATKKALESIGLFNSELNKSFDSTDPEVIKCKKEVSDILGKLNSDDLLTKLDNAMNSLKNISFGA